MIGIHVNHTGVPCKVVEVLEDGPSLVLISIDENHIQADQYGNPARRVPQTYTVPILTADGGAIHPAYMALDLVDRE